MGALTALLAEPHQLVRAVLRWLPVSIRTKALWDAAPRPHYLVGLLYAADQAKREGRSAISAIEFGVAEGAGLLALQAHAAAVEQATGVTIHLYGFDGGEGMPAGAGDHRDHPDVWQTGDYRMDVAGLKAKLTSRTELVIGDVRETVSHQPIAAPLGFVAVDLDFYSSTVTALSILRRADVARLRRVAMFFDDVRYDFCHERAGELLAIEEFNRYAPNKGAVVIDRWRGLKAYRPFPDASWIEGMYIAHDLDAISAARLSRKVTASY